MSLLTGWDQRYKENAIDEAIYAWCAVHPEPSDWQAWFARMESSTKNWGTPLFEALGQNEKLWENFLRGASLSSAYQTNLIKLLDYIRVKSMDTGKLLEPLPLGCLEGLNAMISSTTPQWKQQLLMRSPDYWFGEPCLVWQGGVAPMHELSVKLLCESELPRKRLPNLSWSPSALYDDYGRAPKSVELILEPIQHALEYAVYLHQMNDCSDSLDHVELFGYFQKYNINLAMFEALVDFSHETPTLGSYIQVLHKMLSPQTEQYHVDLSNDSPQP